LRGGGGTPSKRYPRNHNFTFTRKYTENLLGKEILKVVTGENWKDTKNFRETLRAKAFRTKNIRGKRNAEIRRM